jgi:dihydrofolate reductase
VTTDRPGTVAYIATSLDGFIARSDGGIDWLGEPPEGEDYGWAAFLATIDAIVMGRATFEQVATFDSWPYEGKPLTVLSSTMRAVPEHLRDKAEFSTLDPGDLLRQLSARGRKRVYVDGGRTIQSFLRNDLIDEIVITRLPLLIGEGIPLFGSLGSDLAWAHLATEVIGEGLVKSAYRRRR